MVELVSSNISKYDKVNVSLACEFVLASPRLDAQRTRDKNTWTSNRGQN